MNLDWRRGILYLTTMGMEGCWLYTLIALLNKQVADGRLSTIGLLLVYPLAFVGNRLLKRLPWPKIGITGISWLAWVVVMLLVVKIVLFSGVAWSDPVWLQALPQALAQMLYSFRPELLILVSSAGLWWLGRRLAYIRVNFAAAVTEFQFGLAILLVIFWVMSQLQVNLADSITVAVSYFLFALLGMSLAHAQEGSGWLAGMYRGQWSGLLLVSLGLVVILGFIISAVLTPDLLQLVLSALKWVGGLIWGLIIKVLDLIASLLPAPGPSTLPSATPLPPAGPAEVFSLEMPEWLRSGLHLGLNILWLGLIVAALWQISSQIFGWLRRRLASMAGAEIEPLPGAFRADLFGWLKRVLLRLLGFRLTLRLARKSQLVPEVASVRQIYRRLLRWAAAGGYPRQVFQTPYEYLGVLEGVLPEAGQDLDFVTEQFVSTRYGGSLPTEDDLRRLKHSWHNISQNRLNRPLVNIPKMEVKSDG